MTPTNQDYWQSQSGAEYRQQQQWRAAEGNQNYREQEAWIVAHLRRASERLGRPVKVLDFGCGFGRMAHVLAQCPFVEYYGYDFSAPMVQPLVDAPPAELEPVNERVRVAKSAPEAFPGRRFDVVFTVSVLIHNSRDDASRLLRDMISMLDQEGHLLLVENQLVPFDVKENNWHAGCWVHDYAGDLTRDFDVEIVHGQIPNHDVYIVRPARDAQRTLLLIDGDAAPRPLTEDDRLRLGMPRLQTALQGLEGELEHRGLAQAEGRLHDLAEENAALARKVEALQRTVEEQQRAMESLKSVQELRKRLYQTMAQAHQESQPLHVVPEASDDSGKVSFARAFPPERTFEWQATRDTMYANADERFGTVCHIFHHDWVGMRSAVGALPGWKLSIPSANGMPVRDIEVVIGLMQEHGVRKLVMHGISDPMYALSRSLTRAGYDQQYLVWHGTTTQWVWDDERRFAQRAIQMAREGKIRRFSAIRRGLGPIVGERNFAPQLVNMPPLIADGAVAHRSHRSDRCSALAPSWNDLRKNLATNVLAAQTVDCVDDIYVVAKNFDLPKWLAPKVRKVPYRDHTSMLEMMATMDIVLNVTTIDCHPMVDLEAMSVGTPCVRGPLFLDGLEDHAYVRATAVDNPMSVEDVSRCIDRLLGIEAQELQGMMNDYKRALLELSRQRYMEFLEI
ncbi:methyltransferase domain-containing protein [Caballeronia ptereochthonis]|uniref:Mg-protoporphyrin IX methyl transferase n=1 Tax=Caballeronia ptereochthonis TaxID=1777144 RepID=A0A158BHM3_9BURK|nr:methyltransferase domain-containing protein [Caballeronia ptereochthonis]SAK69575.1 Mg-protoporphyrin IX methyl transferase [Caballeronia ptereochthonis]